MLNHSRFAGGNMELKRALPCFSLVMLLATLVPVPLAMLKQKRASRSDPLVETLTPEERVDNVF